MFLKLLNVWNKNTKWWGKDPYLQVHHPSVWDGFLFCFFVFGSFLWTSFSDECLANLCLPLPVSVGPAESSQQCCLALGISSLAGSCLEALLPPQSPEGGGQQREEGCSRRRTPVLSHGSSVGFGAGVGPVLVLSVGNLAMCPQGFFLLCDRQAWLSHFPSES